MRNLVSNAIKFTPDEGTVTIGVHVISAITGNVVDLDGGRANLGTDTAASKLILRLAVTDTGAGIAKMTWADPCYTFI